MKSYIKKIIPSSVYVPIINGTKYLRSFLYIGNKYECPFCNGNYSKFLPTGSNRPIVVEKKIIGAGLRENALCPRCFSNDRERLVYLYMNKYKESIFNETISILHIAAEKNLSKKLKSFSNINHLSADLYSPLADIKMDITDIKQDDNIYDVIICNHVLEHIPDDIKAMKELYRVLKKGGFAILQVPISYVIKETFEDFSVTTPQEREKIFGQIDHVRIYGSDYTTRLESSGFDVNAINSTDAFNSEEMQKYGLSEDEKIYVCYKH